MAKPGRPRRNPVEDLATQVLLQALSLETGLKPKGVTFEKHFDGLPHRQPDESVKPKTSKWNRFFNNQHSPGRTTIDAIRASHPEAVQYYESSLWKALRAGEQPEKYWLRFFQSLPLAIQARIFTKESTSFHLGNLRPPNSRTADFLLKIGSLDALACGFALLRYFREKKHPFEYDDLETAIFNLYIRHTSTWPLLKVWVELTEYIKNEIFKPNQKRSKFPRESPWTIQETSIYLKRTIDVCILAEKALKIEFENKEERLRFLYWLNRGNSRAIKEAMLWKLKDIEKLQSVTAINSLKWLINKINQHRPANKKISF